MKVKKSESYFEVCLEAPRQYENFYNSVEFHKFQQAVTIDVGLPIVSAQYLFMITERVRILKK